MCLKRLMVLHSNTWNHLTVRKRMSSGSFKNIIYGMCLQIICIWYIYINKIWHQIPYKGWCAIKTKQTKPILRNNESWNVNINVPQTLFPNFLAKNNPSRVDMPLKLIKQSITVTSRSFVNDNNINSASVQFNVHVWRHMTHHSLLNLTEYMLFLGGHPSK